MVSTIIEKVNEDMITLTQTNDYTNRDWITCDTIKKS